jgi:hypothetical protein
MKVFDEKCTFCDATTTTAATTTTLTTMAASNLSFSSKTFLKI